MLETKTIPAPVVETYPEMPPIARELQKGRDFLASHGWYQGGMSDGLGNVCMVGALFKSSQVSPGSMTTAQMALFLAFHQEALDSHFGGVGRFNDTPGRTKEECLAYYDRAIAAALAEGK